MRHLYVCSLFGSVLCALAVQAGAGSGRTTAFVRVNVVPMDRERVVADQTVIVEGDTIVAVGSRLPVPAHARVIDGHKTAYLSPGLVDMHTHSDTPNDLAVYLANGVTTVLHMGGARAGFVNAIVPAVNGGAIPGPHVYVSFRVRLERQLAERQVLIAHAEEFFYTFFTPNGADETDVPPDPSRLPSAVALARRHGVAVTADVATYAAIARQIGRPEVVAAYLVRPESSYLSPSDRLAWQTSGYLNKTAKLGPKLAFLRMLVKAMADAGVDLVAGTDAPTVPGMLPGFSLHDSLGDLEASGLTRFQALTAATRAPGTFIHRTKGGDPFGIVAPGHRADVILSEVNPLATLSTLRTPLGVMVKGRWRDAAALKALTDDVRRSHQRAAEMP